MTGGSVAPSNSQARDAARSGWLFGFPEEVAGGLGCPGSGGVGGDAGQVDASSIDFNEEQDVETAQADRVDTEEVGRDHGVGLAVNELAP